MTRKLLALFALLSGLAALSGPAVASQLTPTSTCDAKVSTVSEREVEGERVAAKRLTKSKVESVKARENLRRSPVPKRLQAPLLMGVERAHE